MNRFGIILLAILLITAGLSAGKAQPVAAQGPDPRFGIVESYVNSEAANDSGAGYTRVILRWDVIQPSGRDDWKPANVPDPFIETELANGRQVAAILIGTPPWAARDEVNDSRAVPDMDAWGNFTKRMAQQYEGRIQHWIIWNEPDVWDMDHRGSTWLGTEAEYAQLLKVAYQNIKSVNPANQIFVTGLTYHWDAQYDREQYLSRLLRIIAADPDAPANNFYFDGAVYHLYYKPQQMFNIVTEIRGILDSYGVGNKAIWVNETNAPPTDDPVEPPWAEPHFVVSSQEQANFVIQAYALLIAAGVERIEFYKMRNSLDHPEDIEPYGLLRHDDSRRLAFEAFKVVTKHFAGFNDYSWVNLGNFYIVTLTHQDRTTTVLWNTSQQDRPFAINAIATEALLVDEMGNEEVIAAQNGVYNIVLPGATCSAGDCFIGGAPRLLVENGSPGQRASLIPLATETPTPTALPTNTPVATDTPSPSPTPSATATAEPVTATPPAQVVADTNIDNQPDNPPVAHPALTLMADDEEVTQEEMVIFTLGSVFTPGRVVILLVFGGILFTVFYFMQFKLWNKWRR